MLSKRGKLIQGSKDHGKRLRETYSKEKDFSPSDACDRSLQSLVNLRRRKQSFPLRRVALCSAPLDLWCS
jgi:hypothetical protein